MWVFLTFSTAIEDHQEGIQISQLQYIWFVSEWQMRVFSTLFYVQLAQKATIQMAHDDCITMRNYIWIVSVTFYVWVIVKILDFFYHISYECLKNNFKCIYRDFIQKSSKITFHCNIWLSFFLLPRTNNTFFSKPQHPHGNWNPESAAQLSHFHKMS